MQTEGRLPSRVLWGDILTEIMPARRHIIRAAAWSVPVIAVAATAPAFAASGANFSTSSTTAKLFATGFFGLTQRVETTVVLRNSGTAPTAALTVTISTAGDIQANNQTAPAGWTLTSVDTASDTAVFTRTAQLPAATNETVTFVLRRSPDFGGETVTVAINPGAGGTVTTLTLTNVNF